MSLLVYTKSVAFSWDPNKAAYNLEKHGISFEDATQAFYDPNALEIPGKFIRGENRRILLGEYSGRVLLVVFLRQGRNIRIISAREAEPIERSKYERYE